MSPDALYKYLCHDNSDIEDDETVTARNPKRAAEIYGETIAEREDDLEDGDTIDVTVTTVEPEGIIPATEARSHRFKVIITVSKSYSTYARPH